MEATERLVELLEQAKTEIQQRMEAEDLNATGRSSRSFRVEVYDGGVRLMYGNPETAPLQTLEVGRPGGRVPKGFTDILVEWSRAKGIQFQTERERRTFAYFLGKRIKEEGTLRHMAPVDVYTSIVMDVAAKVKDGAVKSITSFIHSQFLN